ncbi:MAG: type II secretion system F family protein [Gemmatimonadetes bacterium]|nr:type II secretion system F family protein [Gemmatimonadota bacterium]
MTGTLPFRYLALDTAGRREHGRVSAVSVTAAREALLARGRLPIDIAPDRVLLEFRAGVSAEVAARLFSALADLLEAGVLLDRALAIVERTGPTATRSMLTDVRRELSAGATLSESLRAHGVGGPDAAAILSSGEASGRLPAAARQVALLLRHRSDLRRGLSVALAYPALLLCTAVVSVGLIVLVVLPRFAVLLQDMGQQLPPLTRVVLGAANVATQALPALLLGAIALALVAWRWWRTPDGRRTLHAALLAMPGVRRWRHALAASRVCGLVGPMLHAGVPLAHALRVAVDAASDLEIAERLARTRNRVIEGQSLSLSLAAEGTLPPGAIDLVQVGEETGRLAEMLEQAGRHEDRRLQDALQVGLRALEPALIVGFGGFVAVIAAALLQAIYAVRPTT